MTKEEYTRGLLDILIRGWTYTADNLKTRFAMGLVESAWLIHVDDEGKQEFFAHARSCIWLEIADKKITLGEYLGRF